MREENTLLWRKIVDIVNPVEWLVWCYEKVFLNHPLAWYVTTICFGMFFGGVILFVLGDMAVNKYKKEHKDNTAISINNENLAKKCDILAEEIT